MKNKKITLIYLIFLMGICLQMNYSQEKVANNKSKQINAKDIEVKIQNGNIEAKNGDIIQLKILLKNNYSSIVGWSYDRQDLFGGFEVEVIDSKGNIVERIRNPKEKWGFSRSTIELKPKDKVVANLSFSNFYKLEVGKYSVKASIRIKTMKNESIMIISKPVFLIVT